MKEKIRLPKARLEQLEPMEIVQHYTIRYHKAMEQLNTLPPSIGPRASGHITEQIAMVQQILDAGMAYEVNGSVYFDIDAYSKSIRYTLRKDFRRFARTNQSSGRR